MTVEVLKPAFPREAVSQQARGGEQLPIRMIIGGRSYVVSNLTEDDAALVEFDGEVEPGQIILTTLIVSLDGFDISMPALWEVMSRVAERAKLELLLASSNPPSQIARINAVIDAILNGNLVSSTDVLEIAAKKEVGEPIADLDHAVAQRGHHAIRRRIGAVFFFLLAAGLLTFIGANISTRMTIIQADGTIVNPQAVLSRAPAQAELVSFSVPVGSRVQPGNPIAILKTTTGLLTVTSPCDCVLAGEFATSRAMLRQGDPLAQLVPIDGANKALISVPKESLRRIRVGDTLTATFYDTDAKVTGTVERVSPPKVLPGSVGQSAGSDGTVEVRFTQKLPAWRVGEPVTARIRLSRLNPFA